MQRDKHARKGDEEKVECCFIGKHLRLQEVKDQVGTQAGQKYSLIVRRIMTAESHIDGMCPGQKQNDG